METRNEWGNEKWVGNQYMSGNGSKSNWHWIIRGQPNSICYKGI